VLCNRIFRTNFLGCTSPEVADLSIVRIHEGQEQGTFVDSWTQDNLPSGSIKGGEFIDQLLSHEGPCSMEFDRNLLCFQIIYSSECLFMYRIIQLPTMRPTMAILCHWKSLTYPSFLILCNTPVVRNSGVSTDLVQLSTLSTFIEKYLYCCY
jgi:hypothetical protein